MGTSTSTSTSTGADVEALYERHWVPMVRMALLLVDDVAAAEDVVQDAFVALHRRAHRLREPAAALGYLRTSVVNGARSQLRRRGVARRHLGAVVTAHAEPADRPVIVAAEGRDRRGPRGLEGHREVERQPRPGRAAVDFGESCARVTYGGYPVDGRDAPAGSRVRVRVLGGTTVGSARVGASGRWSVQVTPTASHVTVLIATSGGTARRPEHLYVLGVHR